MYRGLPPNPDAVRHDSHPDPVPAVTLVETDELLGPDLPDDQTWCERTREWWNTWRRSPQAKVFLDTDWQYLLETASLHHEFWDEDTPSTQRVKLASEIRMRVQSWGATYADRLKLRMRSPSPADAPPAATTDDKTPAGVTSMVDYRKRLTG